MVCVTAGAQADVAEIPLRATPDARNCVTERALQTRLANLRVQSERARGLSIRVDAASQPVVLEVLRDDGVIAVRRFDALPARCEERLETLALVIALAVEHAVEPPRASEPPAQEEPEPESAPKPPIPPPVPAPTEPVPGEPLEEDEAADPQPEPMLLTVVGIGGGYGLLPALAGLGSAGIEVPGSLLRVGLGALVSTQTHSELAGGTASAQLAGARGYGCFHGWAAALELQACAGLALGVVIASGRDYARRDRGTGTLLSPLLRLVARYPAGSTLSLGLALDGFVHLVRPELEVAGRAGSSASTPLFGVGLAIEGALALR